MLAWPGRPQDRDAYIRDFAVSELPWSSDRLPFPVGIPQHSQHVTAGAKQHREAVQRAGKPSMCIRPVSSPDDFRQISSYGKRGSAKRSRANTCVCMCWSR